MITADCELKNFPLRTLISVIFQQSVVYHHCWVSTTNWAIVLPGGLLAGGWSIWVGRSKFRTLFF